jgi:hypothetical protein
MSWVAVAIAGAAVLNAAVSSNSAKKGAKAVESSSRAGISEQQAAREDFQRRTEPFRQVGLSAAVPLLQSLGIEIPADFTRSITPGQVVTEEAARLQDQIGDLDSQIANFQPRKRGQSATDHDAQRGDLIAQREALQGQLDQFTQAELTQAPQQAPQQAAPGLPESELARVNPLVSFLRDEGFEDIQESAAARGRLRSGGTLEDLTRFNTQLASTVVPQLQQQRFNQLFSVLGLGQNAAVGQGSAALSTASNIGNLLGQAGSARAAGQIAQGQAIGQGISDLTGVLGAQQAGLFSRPPSTVQGGSFNTGTQTDFATGAVSSPVPGTSGGGF